jgi:hypothetical protein
MEKTKRSGGCQCGALRYRITGSLGPAGVCHCRMCQKAMGNFGAALVSVPLHAFQWTRGKPAIFRSSSVVGRGFCAACGTPMFMAEDGDTVIEIAIGTLDDPNAIGSMAEQSGVESKCVWFNDLRDLPVRTTADYRSAADLARLKSLQHPDHDTEHWP